MMALSKYKFSFTFFILLCLTICYIEAAGAQEKKNLVRPAVKGQVPNRAVQANRPAQPIRITSPSFNSRHCSGSNMKIVWESSLKKPEPVKIEVLSQNAVFYTVAKSAANNGNFSWTIPAGVFSDQIGQYSLRIQTVRSRIYGISPLFFIGRPGLKILSPASNQIVQKRMAYPVTWQQGCFQGNITSSYQLTLLNESKSGVMTIHPSLPFGSSSPQTFNWQVPDTLNNGRYYIRVEDDSRTLRAEQPVLVTSMPHPWKAAQITITKPSSNVYWCRGQQLDIRWQASLPQGNPVKIQLLKHDYSPAFIITASTANDGQFTAMPPQGIAGASYHLAIGSTDDSIMTESGINIIYRGDVFSIAGSGNTGIWRMGDSIETSYWLSNCFSGNPLRIELVDSQQNSVMTIVNISGGFGLSPGMRHPFQFTVPVSINPGTYYLKISEMPTGLYATDLVNIGYPQ